MVENSLNGLVSKGGLIRKFSEEMSKTISAYTDLYGKKLNLYLNLKKSRESEKDKLISDLIEVLSSEKKFWENYSSIMITISLPRKLLGDMRPWDKGGTLSKEQFKEVKLMLKILNELEKIMSPSFFHKSIPELIDMQIETLKNKNISKFRNYLLDEDNRISNVLKVCIEFYPDVANSIKSSRKKILNRHLAIHIAKMMMPLIALHAIHQSFPDPDLMSIKYKHIGQTEYHNLWVDVQHAEAQEKIESELEQSFSQLSGVALMGEYSVENIEEISLFLKENYSPGFLKKIGVKAIFCIVGEAKSVLGPSPAGIYSRPNLASRSTTMVLVAAPLSIETSDHQFKEYFRHELGHYISFYLKNRSNLYSEWRAIPAFYVTEYAKQNIDEDIAETFSMATNPLFPHNKLDESTSLSILEGNYHEGSKSILQKIQLLKKYGFFDEKVLFAKN